MSEYVPTANEVKHWLCEPHYAGGLFDDETAEKFDRMIAEVERAAAEKAWDRCVGEMPIDLDWKNFYGDNNPYRREETG